ncbi:hypothetical protein [Calothrix sp. 336/3]|uniref:hypothetical protein n=1 Tax=Calothrix sp. 336/3 TaxID=1337936 RepID=UPI001EDD0423|nr:hypothetical protein [Calothrix sp. 336/3]
MISMATSDRPRGILKTFNPDSIPTSNVAKLMERELTLFSVSTVDKLSVGRSTGVAKVSPEDLWM